MNALSNPMHDITRYGWDIVASPRHADIVTVTGPITTAMRAAAHETIDATPQPRIVVAIGDCAAGDGIWKDAESSGEGAVAELGARVVVRGCPPAPDAIVAGLEEASKLLG
jgi:Ni,Fe-hydrogenase III small subunit